MYETDEKGLNYPDIWLIFIPYMALRGPQIAICRSKEVKFLQKINEVGPIGAINEWLEPKRYKICCLANTIYITDGYKTQY